MYRLTKLKLINWHHFDNHTIVFQDNALLTGANGTGKSTIIDAMQFVLTGGRAKFNTAIKEKAARDLLGYVRNRVGKEGLDYKRTGDVTANVALEFTGDNNTIIVGTVIDSPSSLSNPNVLFYVLNDTELVDSLFCENKIIYTISDFKKKHADYITFETSRVHAQKMLQEVFGSIESRFFRIFTNTITFQPQDDINKFVFEFLLEEKPLDIEGLQDNINKYNEFIITLEEIRKEMNMLEEITNEAMKIDDINKESSMEDLLYHLLMLEKIKHEYQSIQDKIRHEESKIKDFEHLKNNTEQEYNKLFREKKSLESVLGQSDSYVLIREIEDSIKKYDDKIKLLESKKITLNDMINRELQLMRQLIPDQRDLIEKYYNTVNNLNSEDDLENLRRLSSDIYSIYRDKKELLEEQRQDYIKERSEVARKIDNYNRQVSNLSNRKLDFPPDVVALMDLLKDQLSQIFKQDVQIHVLCEVIDILDEQWRNAIEGMLGYSRFALILDPQYYDAALSIYKENRHQISNARIINTRKLPKNITPDNNSLATHVISQIPDAKAFITILLGNIRCVETEKELENYPRAVTKSCMLYQQYQLSAISSSAYSRHYIGKNAIKTQLNHAQSEKEKLTSESNKIYTELMSVNQLIDLLNNNSVTEIADIAYEISDLDHLKLKQREEKQRVSSIDNQSTEATSLELKNLEIKIGDYEHRIRELDHSLIDVKGIVSSLTKESYEKKDVLDTYSSEIENIKRKYSSIEPFVKERLDKIIKDPTSIASVILSISKKIESIKTKYDEQQSVLRQKQLNYKEKYQFGGGTGYDNVFIYQDKYEELKHNKLLEYEANATKAKTNAEQQFKEQCLSKLRQYIEEAQIDFKRVNEALKGFVFGRDEYEFAISPSKVMSMESVYKLIMDDDALSRDSTFDSLSGSHPYATDTIKQLLFKGGLAEAGDILDYRRYLDYDIIIKYEDGSSLKMSTHGKLKSAGERQTPYYVTIIASMLHIYNSAPGESIGLVLFDETFDKMDLDRTFTMMEFITKLPLQIVISCPPVKLDISRYTPTFIGLLEKDGKIIVNQEFRDLKALK